MLHGQGYIRFKAIVLTYLRQVKLNLGLAFLCMVGVTVAEILGPWPLKIIFDYILFDRPLPPSLSFLQGVLENDNITALLIISFAIVLIAVARAGFYYFQTFLTSRTGYELVYVLRTELVAHLHRLSLSFHARARAGELLTKITGDTNALRQVFTDSLLTSSGHLLTLGGMLVIMLFLNWQLSLIILLTFPLMFLFFPLIFRRLMESTRHQRKYEGNVASRLSELLSSVSVTRAFGQEQHEQQRFEQESARTVETGVREARLGALAILSVEMMSVVGTWAVIFFGSLLVLRNDMTPGDVLIFISYVRKTYKPIRHLTKLSSKYTKAMVSAERLSEILAVEPGMQDEAHALTPVSLKGEIVFDQVRFGYEDGALVLQNLSFRIEAGSRVALLGASGAGKSTIISLILRLYEPESGAIFIDGVNLHSYQKDAIRHKIGIVLQDSVLFGSSIRENIIYGKTDATPEEIDRAARQAMAYDFIDALQDKYETLVGERGSTLSGGQRQRICLARALIKQPSILILDEATSAVDAESECAIQETLNTLNIGKTTITIAHRLTSMHCFDAILVLRDGVIVERGTHDELLSRDGYYRDLVRPQVVVNDV